ncbi:hypothetical protein BGZ76_005527, partial [Entomortierella beljakovae]
MEEADPVRYRNYSRHPRSLREKGLTAATLFVLHKYMAPDGIEINYELLMALYTYFYFEVVRYLNPRPAANVYRSPVYRDEVLSLLSPIDFKDAMHVTPLQFNFIVEVIQDHPVFLRRGRKPQREVATQLKVALHRLAHDGSHSSYSAYRRILDVSVGSIVTYTRRCVDALCDNIERFVTWPNN